MIVKKTRGWEVEKVKSRDEQEMGDVLIVRLERSEEGREEVMLLHGDRVPVHNS